MVVVCCGHHGVFVGVLKCWCVGVAPLCVWFGVGVITTLCVVVYRCGHHYVCGAVLWCGHHAVCGAVLVWSPLCVSWCIGVVTTMCVVVFWCGNHYVCGAVLV